MPLDAPQLDTRTFEEIFREARLRIPRYTPEWTDFNESDPGITLLQLYSWLTEMILFQVNRVPERNYIKFLQLLGMELNPAAPARVRLTFVARPADKLPRPVPRGAQVAGQGAGGGDPVIFETEAGLTPIPLKLGHVLVFDGASFADVSRANEAPDTPFRPLGFVPQSGSVLYLGFEPPDSVLAGKAPAGRLFPREIRFHSFLPEAGEKATTVICGVTPPAPPVTLVWEYLPSDETRRWRRLNLFADTTNALTAGGEIVIEGPGEDIRPARVGRVSARYWLRCRLASGGYPAGREPEIDLLRPNTVSAVALTTVRDEILGASEGLPDQFFETRHTPVERDSFELSVEGEDIEDETWQRVDDFLASGSDDPHYVLDAGRGRVSFGDGRGGRIPPAGAEIIALAYRHGGGTAGNLPADAVTAPLVALDGIESVSNPRAAVGGRGEQDVEELKRRAPAVLRHRNRAVTAEDFAALAREAGGVADATAIAGGHPDHPGVEVPGAVTVVVLPDRDEVPPRPSQELLDHLCRYLDRFRLLTTEVYVKEPVFRKIEVSARLTAPPYAAFDAVARDAARALDRFLDPRTWGFGRDLQPTAFYDVLLDAGAVAVLNLDVEVDGRPHDLFTEPVPFAPDEVAYGGRHDIVVTVARDL